MSVGESKSPSEAAPLLLGVSCVALASLCFSFMSTFIKYMTFTFSSMEATFWRSVGVLVCNYVSFTTFWWHFERLE